MQRLCRANLYSQPVSDGDSQLLLLLFLSLFPLFLLPVLCQTLPQLCLHTNILSTKVAPATNTLMTYARLSPFHMRTWLLLSCTTSSAMQMLPSAETNAAMTQHAHSKQSSHLLFGSLLICGSPLALESACLFSLAADLSFALLPLQLLSSLEAYVRLLLCTPQLCHTVCSCP